MNEDTMKGQWHQLRGKVKEKWGKLTDDDIRVIEGRAENLRGKLQERYGKTREELDQEMDAFAKENGFA